MADTANLKSRAIAHHQRGEFAEAIELYRLAIKRQPDVAALHFNLGSALEGLGEYAAAAEAFRRAVQVEPSTIQYLKGRSRALRMIGREEESLTVWRDAIGRRPRESAARLELARALVIMRRIDDALATLEQVLADEPANVAALTECARLSLRLGRTEQAEDFAQRTLAVDAHNADALVHLARVEARRGETDRAAARLSEVMKQDDAKARGSASLELATLLEKRGDYDNAFATVEAGQAALFSRLSAAENNLAPAEAVIIACQRMVTAEVVAEWKPPPADARPAPVFIVGFPRSGTTLLEQMLSAHPNLIVTDELPLLQRVKDATIDRLKVRQPYPQSLSALGDRQLAALREAYFDAAKRMIGEEAATRRLVDKSPLNTIDLCVVRRIFPEAKVIVALRDPRDVVLSSFFQAFARGTPHFYGFETTARLYAMTMNLWLHYRRALGLTWKQVRYEDVVVEPEASARGMIEFIGEPWDDAVLRYYEPEHQRYVTTPSYADVAKPVYRTSVRRWERYRAQFERVRPMLEPLVREFGYGEW